MSKNDSAPGLLKRMFQAHPWHGVSPGADVPDTVNAYIEIVPTDAVKYELDKESGHLARRSAATIFVDVSLALRVYSAKFLRR